MSKIRQSALRGVRMGQNCYCKTKNLTLRSKDKMTASKSLTLEMEIKVKIMLTQEPSDPPSCFDYPPKKYSFFEKKKVLEWSNSARKLIKKNVFFFAPKNDFFWGPG